MDWLVLLMVGVRQIDQRPPIESEFAVRLGISDWPAFRRRLKRGEIWFAVLERAEHRDAERIGPHVQSTKRHSADRAEFRPQRLGVAHAPQIVADRRSAPRLVVSGKFVMRAAFIPSVANRFPS